MGWMNHRTWGRAEWKSHGEDRSPESAAQGEWKACPVAPVQRRERSFMVRGRPLTAGIWMAQAGGSPIPGKVHTRELVSEVVGPC